MTDRKSLKPAAATAVPAGSGQPAPFDRAAAARDISVAIRALKGQAEAENLKMVAYLLNLAELEALDCAGATVQAGGMRGDRCA